MRFFNYRAVYNFADELHDFHEGFRCDQASFDKNLFWFESQIRRFIGMQSFDDNVKKAIMTFVASELCGPNKIVGKSNFRSKFRRFIEANFEIKVIF